MRYRILLPVLLIAACAATPRQREMQYVQAIKAANDATAAALDFDIIKASEAEAVQAATRTATVALREAIAGRRAGKTDAWDIALKAVEKALSEAMRILEGRE